MHKNYLIDKLNKMYLEAEENDKTTMIRLFGIIYGDIILKNKITATELANESLVNNSYHVEISKGIRLSKYVVLKE